MDIFKRANVNSATAIDHNCPSAYHSKSHGRDGKMLRRMARRRLSSQLYDEQNQKDDAMLAYEKSAEEEEEQKWDFEGYYYFDEWMKSH